MPGLWLECLRRGDELRPLGKGTGLDSGAGAGVGVRGIPVLANRPRGRGRMKEVSGGMRQHNIMFPAPPSRPTVFLRGVVVTPCAVTVHHEPVPFPAIQSPSMMMEGVVRSGEMWGVTSRRGSQSGLKRCKLPIDFCLSRPYRLSSTHATRDGPVHPSLATAGDVLCSGVDFVG
jgi:hypothetical protein